MALFVGFWLTPRAAEASCGDYVRIGGQAAMAAHDMHDQPKEAKDHGAPHRPCRGPGCSRAPLPAQAPVPVTVVLLEQWAVVNADAPPTLHCRTKLLAEPAERVAAGFRSSILRPPR